MIDIAEILFLSAAGIACLFALLASAAYIRTIPCRRVLPGPPFDRTQVDGVVTVRDAVVHCGKSGLRGWELVELAQRLTAKKLEYSFCNSWDMPDRAFERGMGYCWHKATALKTILENLGFEVRMVHAFKNRYPDFVFNGARYRDFTTGHAWLRVSIGDEVRDVCPGNVDNSPGIVDFITVSRVRRWGPVISFVSYFGSAWVNASRFSEHAGMLKSRESTGD